MSSRIPNHLIKVGVVGSRSRNTPRDKALIHNVLLRQIEMGRNIALVSGGCYKGADLFAEELAKELNLDITIFPVETQDYMPRYMYRVKAFERNTLIAEESDVLLVTWDGQSGGTKDTILKTKQLNKPIITL